MSKERQMDFRYFVSEVCVNGIQEVASSILVSSTATITPPPLVLEPKTDFLVSLA